jgi:tetrahydromethanopterin S-methyltransferase subunit G
MEAMRQSWTDDRLDALNEKVDLRFDQVDQRFEQVDQRFDVFDREVQRRFDEVDRRLDRADERFAGLEAGIKEINGRLDAVNRSVTYLAIGLTTAMLAGFGGMTTLIATQV